MGFHIITTYYRSTWYFLNVWLVEVWSLGSLLIISIGVHSGPIWIEQQSNMHTAVLLKLYDTDKDSQVLYSAIFSSLMKFVWYSSAHTRLCLHPNRALRTLLLWMTGIPVVEPILVKHHLSCGKVIRCHYERTPLRTNRLLVILPKQVINPVLWVGYNIKLEPGPSRRF